MNDVHLCLSALIDEDLSAYEYFQSLSGKVQQLLMSREIGTLEELQENAARIMASGLYR